MADILGKLTNAAGFIGSIAAPLAPLAPVAQAGAAIGSAISAGGANRFALQQQKEMADLEWKRSQEAADVAYARQRELMDLQNAYSSPQQQVNRLAAAGLNKQLAVGGSLQNTSASPSSVAAAAAPTGVGSAIGQNIIQGNQNVTSLTSNAVSSAVGMVKQLQEIGNISQGTKNLALQGELTKYNIQNQNIDNQLKSIKLRYADAVEAQALQIGQSQIDLNKANMKKALNDVTISMEKLKLQKVLQSENIKEIRARVKNFGVEFDRIVSQTNLNDEQKKYVWCNNLWHIIGYSANATGLDTAVQSFAAGLGNTPSNILGTLGQFIHYVDQPWDMFRPRSRSSKSKTSSKKSANVPYRNFYPSSYGMNGYSFNNYF